MPKRSRDTTRRFAAQVEYPDAPHAVETLEAAFAPLRIGGEHDLGIAVSTEQVALRFKFGAKLAEIVDLAVEDDPRSFDRRYPSVGRPVR